MPGTSDNGTHLYYEYIYIIDKYIHVKLHIKKVTLHNKRIYYTFIYVNMYIK